MYNTSRGTSESVRRCLTEACCTPRPGSRPRRATKAQLHARPTKAHHLRISGRRPAQTFAFRRCAIRVDQHASGELARTRELRSYLGSNVGVASFRLAGRVAQESTTRLATMSGTTTIITPSLAAAREAAAPVTSKIMPA